MVFFTFTHDKVDAEVLQKYILNEGIKVDLTVKRNGKRRFMTHHYIRHQEIEKLIAVMESY